MSSNCLGYFLAKSYNSDGSLSISYNSRDALSKSVRSLVLATIFHFPSRIAILASCSQKIFPLSTCFPTNWEQGFYLPKAEWYVHYIFPDKKHQLHPHKLPSDR